MKIMLQAKKAESSRNGLIFSFVAIINEGNGKIKIIDLDENMDFTHDPMRAMFEFMRLADKYCDSEPSLSSKTRIRKVEEVLELDNYRKTLEKEDNESYNLKELGREYLRVQDEAEKKKSKRRSTKANKSEKPKNGKIKSSKTKTITIDFSGMLVSDLRKYAKDNKVRLGRDITRKKDIIKILEGGA